MKNLIKTISAAIIITFSFLFVCNLAVNVFAYESYEGTEVIGERIYEGTQRPLSDGDYDLGTSAYRWAKGWFTDLDATSATIATLSVTSSVNPGPLEIATSTNPSIRFKGDTNTGISWRDYDELGLMTNGTDRLIIDTNGDITIGQDLTVSSNATTTGWFYVGQDLTVDGMINGNITGSLTGAASGNLLNSESDTLTGTLTADGLTLGSTELLTIGSNLFTHDGSDFTLDDTLEITGYASSTSGLNTQGTLHIGSNGTIEGTLTLPDLGTAAGVFLAANANGDVIATTTPSGGASLIGTTGQIAYFSDTNTAVGTSTIFITPTQRVGIGTESPNSLFQVEEFINFGDDYYNTYIGYQAGLYNLGDFNTYIGYKVGSSDNATGKADTADYNTAIGYETFKSNDTGNNNTAIGKGVLEANTGGSNNAAFGSNALNWNTTGSLNTALGIGSLGHNQTGDSNIGLGYYAGFYEQDSDAFYVNNINRTNTAGDKTKSILYGQMNVTESLQILTVNDNLIVSGNSTTTLDAVVGSESNTATSTLSIKTDGTHGSCIEWTNVAGVIYREYVDASGTKVLETGTCK